MSSPFKVMASMQKHFPAFFINPMPYRSQSDSLKGNSEQEGTSAKTSLKKVFLGNITTFSRVNRKVSAYFLVGIQN